MILAEDVGDERVHPCRREEDRRIVLGNQGGSGDLRMILGYKEFYEFVA